MDYLIWDRHDRPVVLNNEAAVARTLQAAGKDRGTLWLLTGETVNELRAFREGDEWVIRDHAGLYTDTFAADPLDDPRALDVVDYVVERIESLPGHERVDLIDWDQMTDEPNYVLFGFTRPDELGDWAYCPQLVAEQTAEMADTEFERYLDGWAVRLYLAWENRDKEPHVREAIIGDALTNLNPGVEGVMLEWQLHILDRRDA